MSDNPVENDAKGIIIEIKEDINQNVTNTSNNQDDLKAKNSQSATTSYVTSSSSNSVAYTPRKQIVNDHGMAITSSNMIFSNLTIPSLSPDDPLNTPVIDICNRYLLLLPDTTKIEDVLIKLQKSKSQSFVVTNEYNEYVRFYTQKEIYYKVVIFGKMNEVFTLKDLMEMDEKSNNETQCVSNTNTLIECLSIMRQNNVESIAVSEGVTGITGIITLDDITDFLSQEIKLRRNPPRKLTPFEKKIDNVFASIFFQVGYIALMLVSVAVFALSFTHIVEWLMYISPVLILFMFIISLLRIKLKGIGYLDKRDILEAFFLFVAVIFSVLYLLPIDSKAANRVFYFSCASALFFHIFFVIPCRVRENKRKMKSSTKRAVSTNKARYKKDGFDLDLTYITPRCIAMSLPAENIEMLYRNPIGEVVRFFDTKHPGFYRIYNLCKERNYNAKYFHGNVVRFPIPDHNVPTLRIMYEFSKDVRKFLSSNPQNVIAVHCKGGKGRTGCMICAYLVNSGVCNNTDEALDRFASKRTYGETKNQGVTCPSQKRFVHYFEQFLEDLFIYYNNPIDIVTIKDEEMEELFNKRYNKEITIERITINNLPKMKDIRFRIVDYNGKQLYISSIMNIKALNKSQITIEPNLKVRNEFRFECKGKFYMWQHSYFVCERKIYNKQEIDGICNNPNYPDNFCIDFMYKSENKSV